MSYARGSIARRCPTRARARARNRLQAFDYEQEHEHEAPLFFRVRVASLIVLLCFLVGASGASEDDVKKDARDDPTWVFMAQDRITVAQVEIPFGTEAFRLWTESLDPKVEYTLAGHADLEYRVVQRLMEAMAEVGVHRMRFVIRNPQAPPAEGGGVPAAGGPGEP